MLPTPSMIDPRSKRWTRTFSRSADHLQHRGRRGRAEEWKQLDRAMNGPVDIIDQGLISELAFVDRAMQCARNARGCALSFWSFLNCERQAHRPCRRLNDTGRGLRLVQLLVAELADGFKRQQGVLRTNAVNSDITASAMRPSMAISCPGRPAREGEARERAKNGAPAGMKPKNTSMPL